MFSEKISGSASCCSHNSITLTLHLFYILCVCVCVCGRCSKHWQFTLSSSCWLASGLSCHVIVRSRLSLFQGVTGCCCHCLLVRRQCGVQYLAGANPSFVSGRGQGTPWTSCQLIASCTRWATAAPGLWIITVKWMSISLDMVFRLFSWGWCAISKARLGHQMV